MRAVELSPKQASDIGIEVSRDGGRRTALDLLTFANVEPSAFSELVPEFAVLPDAIQMQVRNDALYAHFARRQALDIAALRQDEQTIIPQDFDFTTLSGLSAELTQKLLRTRPDTLAQAGRIEGMTPAALVLILGALRRETQRKAL